TATQIVTVKDHEKPVITCPPAVTVQCATAVPAAATSYAQFAAQGGSATDNCTPQASLTVAYSDAVPVSNGCVNKYHFTRTYTLTDSSNNSSSCTQTITVNDTTPPSVTCPGLVTVQCASSVPAPNTSLVSASDNCGGPVTVTFVNDVISGQTCPNKYTITRTYKATDSCNKSATCTQTITVNDTTPPTITCPANINDAVANPGDLCKAETFNVQSTDACGGTPTIVCNPPSGACFPVGKTTV